MFLRLVLPAYYPIDDQAAYTIRDHNMKAYIVRYENVRHLGELTNKDAGRYGKNLWKSNIWGSKFGFKKA